MIHMRINTFCIVLKILYFDLKGQHFKVLETA